MNVALKDTFSLKNLVNSNVFIDVEQFFLVTESITVLKIEVSPLQRSLKNLLCDFLSQSYKSLKYDLYDL